MIPARKKNIRNFGAPALCQNWPIFFWGAQNIEGHGNHGSRIRLQRQTYLRQAMPYTPYA
jgi:hypothetical protein